MYDAVYKLSLFFSNTGIMTGNSLTISFFFKYVEFQYRVLKLLAEIKETVKANPNTAFRKDCICFEKFDDVEKFLEFDDELKNNEEKFRELVSVIFRSSRSKVFCKKGVLRNFAKFTGKHLCQSSFLNKVAPLRPATLVK